MDNDKVFGIYAIAILAGVTSTLAATVMAGVASLPSPVAFIEHVSLGLLFRAAYKGIGGFDWADWSLLSEPTEAAAPAADAVPDVGFHAGATS